MSIKITFDSVTIEITPGAERQASAPSDLLGALIAGLFDATDEAGQDTPDATDEAIKATLPTLTSDDINAFLASDPRYTKRSAEAVHKHFEGMGYTEDQVKEAAGSGGVDLIRGATGTIYMARTPQSPSANRPAAVTDVLDMIRSDERFSQRTMGALLKMAADRGLTDTVGAVLEALDEGSVITRLRSSDGVLLYSAA